MDTKRMLLAMLLIMALGPGWEYFLRYEYSVHPEWKRPGDQQAANTAATQPSANASTTQAAAQYAATGATTQPATQPGGWTVAIAPESPAQIKIGADDFQNPRYHMGLAINPIGSGIDSVTLNEFRQQVDSPAIYFYQDAYPYDVTHTRVMSVQSATLDGTKIDIADAKWNLEQRSDQKAVYSMEFDKGGAPAVKLARDYVITPASADPTTPQGYEVKVTFTLTNLSAAPHTAGIEFNGPTVPKPESAQQGTEIVAAYDNDGFVKLDHQALAAFHGTSLTKDYILHDAVAENNLPLVWVGVTGNYFNAIVRPDKPKLLAAAVATGLNPDAPSDQRIVGLRFATTNFDLAPAGNVQVPLNVFFGPKKRSVLNSAYYSTFPTQYDQTLVLMTNWLCGLCTFPWLISFLVMLLAMFHVVLRDWGLAIIVLVCLVRILVHPITKRSQVSMMKMQKLAPEIERLKKKFGDDKDAFSKAQMELYKGVGFTPILGCLPMFLQTPIFIALWRALQTTFELRQAPFLYFFGHHLTWIHDLSQPDQLIKFASPIPLPFGWHIAAINILPMAMAVVTFVNQKYFTPKPAAMSPEQEQQQKMMVWMTLVFPFMFYTFPSGLNLYYLTSTTLGIFESKRIRDHIKQNESTEAGRGPVIVDAGKLSRASRHKAIQQTGEPKKKGWIERLQERAEQMAREAQQKKKR